MAVAPDQHVEPLSRIERMREALWELEPPYFLEIHDATPKLFEELSHEDLRCEFLDGVLIVHSPASPAHEELVSFAHTLINAFVSPRRLGVVYAANAISQLTERRVCADISFLAGEHRDRVQHDRIMGPMDLVVEVLSPSTRRYDLGRKRRAYHEGRVREIWFIDPKLRQFHLDTLIGDAYEEKTWVTGRFAGTVLPGLTVDVDWFWSTPLPDPLACLGLFGDPDRPTT